MSTPTEHNSDRHYVAIWAALLVALLTSLALGAFVPTTMVVAWIFAIAIIKSGIVVMQFMHLGLEPRWIRTILLGALCVVIAFFVGTLDDIVVGFGRG